MNGAEKPLPLQVSGRPLPGWPRVFMFGACAAAAAVMIGLLAAWVQNFFASVLLFPVLIGLLLGFALMLAMERTQLGQRLTSLAVAVLASLVTVLVIHWTSYRVELAAATGRPPEHDLLVQAFPDLAASGHGTPESFVDYLRLRARRGRVLGSVTVRDAWLWLWWGLDVLLIVLPALGFVVAALNQPFCRHCHSWYRTVQRGNLTAPNAAALGGLEGVPSQYPGDLKYDISRCQGGCGPTRLRLSWDNDAESRDLWLNADQWQGAAKVINESARHFD